MHPVLCSKEKGEGCWKQTEKERKKEPSHGLGRIKKKRRTEKKTRARPENMKRECGR
jgi:hypothetical protein